MYIKILSPRVMPPAVYRNKSITTAKSHPRKLLLSKYILPKERSISQ